MEWTRKKTIQFIECYRAYPILWDSKHEFYKNKIKRHDALLEIAAKFEVEKVEVERKIKNLQSHFLREKKKGQNSQKSGFGADESFTSKWFAYKSLLFLSRRNKPHKVIDSQMESLIVEESEQSGSTNHGVGSHFANFRENTEERLLESSRESSSRKRIESKTDPLSDSFSTSKRQRRVQNLTVASKYTEEGSSHNEDRSQEAAASTAVECDLYGQFLAQKLKPLDVEDRLLLMNDIDNLVFKHLMNIRNRSKFSRSAELQPLIQGDTDNRQSMDLSGCSSRSNLIHDESQNVIQNPQHEMSLIVKTETRQKPAL